MGSALEDAQRRDFTINALFYNINDDCVEDFCGTGLYDLQHGLIRTPISPFVTFKDDPLRVLRAVRFCSRFNFILDEDLILATQHEHVKEALYGKVSRERVYKECEGMIYNSIPPITEEEHTLGCRPALAFVVLHRMNILDAVFYMEHLQEAFPFHSTPVVPGQSQRELELFPSLELLIKSTGESLFQTLWAKIAIDTVLVVNLLSAHPKDFQRHEIVDFVFSEDLQWQLRFGHHVKTLFYAAVLMSIQHVSVVEKKREVPFAMIVLRDGLKMESVTVRS
jgi:tRNA nucleotidyltransferase/poly(A) polymerase